MNLKRVALLLAGTALAASAVAWAAPPQKEPDRTGGPYVPTPQVVVDEMLRMAKVGASDYVIDLGSGDGVIVLTAATQYKARGFGVKIDPELVKLSNAEAKRRGVADRVSFQVQDVFKADLSRATVLTLYLLPSMMTSLRSKIYDELKPGTRVVSHDYHFGSDWQPDEQMSFDVPEKEKINGVPRATIYVWHVPAKVAGRWQLQIDTPGGQYELALKQRFQAFEGAALAAGRSEKLEHTELRGEVIRFAFNAGPGRHVFRGRVTGDTMQGTVDLGTGRGVARWTARRAATQAAVR